MNFKTGGYNRYLFKKLMLQVNQMVFLRYTCIGQLTGCKSFNKMKRGVTNV